MNGTGNAVVPPGDLGGQETHNLLIVEDNPGDAAFLDEMLTEHVPGEVNIWHAATLAKATAILAEEAIDAVILDLGLPDSRGMDTLKSVVALPCSPIIIVVAGALDKRMLQQARAAGADDVFSKDEIGGRLFPRIITELVLHSRTLDRSRQLELLVEAMPDAVIAVDGEGIVQSVNRAALDLFGCTHDDIVGELLGFSVAEGRTSEITILRAGQPLLCEMRVAAILWNGGQGHLATIRDVTERRLAEQALRQSETHFAAAQRIAAVGSFVVERATGVQTGTLQFYDIFGFDPTVGETWADFLRESVSPADQKRIATHDEAAWQGKEPAPLEFEFMRPGDGAHRIVMRDVDIVRNADGEPVSLLGVVRDVTDLRLAEARSRTLNRELELRVAQRTEELVAANKELEAFSYSVSHDLRTPLRAIDWLSNSVVEEYGKELPQQVREKMGAISNSALQMGRLIEDLLSFSRIGRQRIRRIEIDLELLVKQLVEELHHAYPDLVFHVEIDELPPLRGDPTLIRLVFQNLLDNAVKFSRAMESPFIHVGCHDSDPRSNAPRIYFVQDNGVGFDMRFADKLFGVFQQLHSRQIYHGTGIGLAIVQRIIHRHGGSVWAESRVGEGAIFSFNLSPEAPDVPGVATDQIAIPPQPRHSNGATA